ncbi:MAG TPA: hypothetical protein VFP43_06295 [Mesorhizobium sp.]|nr:hypothetical protein [Mesorhizobium sp.]
MSVAARARRTRAPPFIDPPGYARHRPERMLLYQFGAEPERALPQHQAELPLGARAPPLRSSLL